MLSIVAFNCALNQLNSYHLVLFLWVRNALMVLAALKWELLLVMLLMLMNKTLHKVFALQVLGVIKARLFLLFVFRFTIIKLDL